MAVLVVVVGEEDLAERGHPGGTRSYRRMIIEDGPALDPVLGEVGRRVVGLRRVQLAAAVGPASVVVGLVLGQDGAQVPLAEDQHPVGGLGSGGEHEPLRKSVRPRAAGGIFTASFEAVFQATGTTILRTAVRARRMNAICKRLMGTLRREVLDRTLNSPSRFQPPGTLPVAIPEDSGIGARLLTFHAKAA